MYTCITLINCTGTGTGTRRINELTCQQNPGNPIYFRKVSKVRILHAGPPAYNPASVFRQDSQKPVIFRNFTIFETDFLILHQNNG